MLKSNALALRREIPVHIAAAVPDQHAQDPLDSVMIRGRVDVLVAARDGAVIIDYKTDAVSPEAVAGRAELYRSQIEAYRAAVEKMTGRPAGAYLVFLTPRMICQL